MTGVIGLLAFLLLIVANALFVAIEFALVSLRRPVVEERAAKGDRRARTVSRELADLSFTFSSAQFGITSTSLVTGYIVEQAVGDTLIRPVVDLMGLPEQATLTVSLTAAFLLSTMMQMVLGELFPKNLALARPLEVALWVAPWTRAFKIALGPIIRVFDGAARIVTERVFRVEMTEELETGHSLDELARIIAASGEEGSISEHQAALLHRAVGLGDRRVGEVMIPRPDVIWLAGDAPLRELRALARATGHSRFPVYGEDEDDVLGTVHVKQLIGVTPEDADAVTVGEVSTPMLAVPESEPLRQLLADLRRERRTAAMVIDEYGGTAGMVTLEDVLEELVGDIEDEFDRRGDLVRRLGAHRHLVGGSLRVDRAGELFGYEMPVGEYDTVAGFVLDRLGHIPEPGEAVVEGPLTVTVAKVDGVRITEVMVARDPGWADEDDGREVDA